MNANVQQIKFNLLSLLVLFIAGEIPLSLISLGAKSKTSAPCGASKYHEFDFWIGDWDAFDVISSTKDARVRVGRILEGCVIHEDYQGIDGRKESFSICDASRKSWHQTSVTNRGQLLIHRRQSARRRNGSRWHRSHDFRRQTKRSRHLEAGRRWRARNRFHLN